MTSEERAQEICKGVEFYIGQKLSAALMAGIAKEFRAAEIEAHNQAVENYCAAFNKRFDSQSPVDIAIRGVAAELGLALKKDPAHD